MDINETEKLFATAYSPLQAYEAYASSMADGGTEVCKWEDLPETDKKAWMAVVKCFVKSTHDQVRSFFNRMREA